MGRHRAADDAAVHPLVADALARRAARAVDPEQEPGEGGIGWPAPAKRGGGLGWPGDLDRASADVTTTAGTTTDGTMIDGTMIDGTATADAPTADAATDAAPAGQRRGVWRRLFGARPAA